MVTGQQEESTVYLNSWKIVASVREHIALHQETNVLKIRSHNLNLPLQRIISAIGIACDWNKLPDSIVYFLVTTDTKKALRTVNFEAALTFNRNS